MLLFEDVNERRLRVVKFNRDVLGVFADMMGEFLDEVKAVSPVGLGEIECLALIVEEVSHRPARVIAQSFQGFVGGHGQVGESCFDCL